jgi:hypothetical protein
LHECREPCCCVVPRDRIELPTRGFSVPFTQELNPSVFSGT